MSNSRNGKQRKRRHNEESSKILWEKREQLEQRMSYLITWWGVHIFISILKKVSWNDVWYYKTSNLHSCSHKIFRDHMTFSVSILPNLMTNNHSNLFVSFISTEKSISMKILSQTTVYQCKLAYYPLSQSLVDQTLANLPLWTDSPIHLRMVQSYMMNLVLPEIVHTDQECGMTTTSNVSTLAGKKTTVWWQ